MLCLTWCSDYSADDSRQRPDIVLERKSKWILWKRRHIEDIGRTALFFIIYIMMSAVILTSRYCEADHKFYNLFSADIYIKMASITSSLHKLLLSYTNF